MCIHAREAGSHQINMYVIKACVRSGEGAGWWSRVSVDLHTGTGPLSHVLVYAGPNKVSGDETLSRSHAGM